MVSYICLLSNQIQPLTITEKVKKKSTNLTEKRLKIKRKNWM